MVGQGSDVVVQLFLLGLCVPELKYVITKTEIEFIIKMEVIFSNFLKTSQSKPYIFLVWAEFVPLISNKLRDISQTERY